MLRWLATLGILALLALDLGMRATPLGRRGSEARLRADVAGTIGTLGQPLPELDLRRLDGSPLRLAELAGRRVVLTFERSVDW
ncbi:MAG: hypothetical protein JSU66_03830 [Deltaproteobacteria bacterium]|nr:MAG: hypothetical protein JSU66_03830 [Deltaproteobacteria bacterium]